MKKIFKNLRLGFIGCLFLLTSQCREYEPKDLDAKSMKSLREESLRALNLVRTDPLGYLRKRKIDANKDCKDSIIESRILLAKAKPVPALKLNEKLNQVALDYSKFLAIHSLFGHNEFGSPSFRCGLGGYGDCGENIAAHSSEDKNAFETDVVQVAQNFVEQFVIDCHVAKRGHLTNLRNIKWGVVGVGYYRDVNSEYKSYVVHNFGSK